MKKSIKDRSDYFLELSPDAHIKKWNDDSRCKNSLVSAQLIFYGSEAFFNSSFFISQLASGPRLAKFLGD